MPSSSAKQRGQQVQRLDLRIAMLGGQFLRALDGFLGFDGEFVESKCHDCSGVRGQDSVIAGGNLPPEELGKSNV